MRHLKTMMIVTALAVALAACGKKAQKPDPKLNDPPEGEATAPLPDGPPVVRQESETPDQPPVEGEDGEAAVTRAELDAFLDKGPPYVLTIVTFEPMHSDQGFLGFQITEVTSGARAFMTPQIRVGDVVTHVNGVRILRPEHLNEAWRTLDKASSVRVDFLRRGEQQHAVWVVK